MADISVIVSEGSDIDANFGEKDVDLGGFPRGNNGHNDLRRFFVNSENDLSDIDEDFDGFDVGWVRDNFRQPRIPDFVGPVGFSQDFHRSLSLFRATQVFRKDSGFPFSIVKEKTKEKV